MFEHFAGRLETRANHQLHCVRIAIFVFGEFAIHVCLPLHSPQILMNFSFVLYENQEPNPEDPLNKEAAEVLQTNRRLFENNVAKAMRGHSVGGTYFEACLK